MSSIKKSKFSNLFVNATSFRSYVIGTLNSNFANLCLTVWTISLIQLNEWLNK